MTDADLWKETASRHLKNEQYYHGLITQIGEMLGEDAYISDDGSRQQDVLCAKIPELVKAKCSALEASKRLLTRSDEKHGECLEALRQINLICGQGYDIESPTKVLELVQKRLEDAGIQRINLPKVRDEDRLGG